MTGLFLASSDVSIRGHVGILPANFPTVSGKKSHQLLVLINNLLKKSVVPVAVGGAGSSGGALFTIFDWC